ncbi:MAG: flavodoxin family protein [Methanomassiliicoccales archaeon]
MRVVGIMGSPRIGGNSDLLLDAALEGARENGGSITELVLETMDITGCKECDNCMSSGKCAVKDDMKQIYELLETLDVLIVSSPVFFSGIPGKFKIMIDRCQSIWARKFIKGESIGGGKKRVGGAILVGGREHSNFEGSLITLRAFFVSVNVKFVSQLTFPGVDRKAAILNHPSALKDARQMGGYLVEVASRG